MTAAINMQARPTPLIWEPGQSGTAPDTNEYLTDESGNILTDENGHPLTVSN